MKLTLAADEPDLVRILVEGTIRDVRWEIKADPLERLLGPGCFARNVLFNLERTDYIDSSGISWLIVCHKHFKQGGGKIVIHSLPPRVQQVLQFLRMQQVFHIAEDEAAARAMVQGEKS